jgi:serine/threonine-protein kinase RsbW
MPEASSTKNFKADLADLRAAVTFARVGAAAAALPESCWPSLDLVVEEVFVNISRYGYPDQPGGLVEMTYTVPRPGVLGLEIADQGLAYNPLMLRQPGLPSSLNERSVGGLGMYLVRRFTEELTYRRDGKWNRLCFEISETSASVRK